MALDSASYGFLQILGLGLAVATSLLLLFSLLRTRIPDVFYTRHLLNTWREYNDYNGRRVPLTQPSPDPSFFGWVSPLFTTDESHVLRDIGPDAAMFLRYITTCLKILSIISLFSLVILLPTYATASNKSLPSEHIEFVEGLRIISLANIPPEDPRLWATVVSEFFIAAVVLYFMASDFRYYSRIRRQYRSSENPSNYCLAVLDIPPHSQTEPAIRRRFDLLAPGQVVQVLPIRHSAKSVKMRTDLHKAVASREVTEYKHATNGYVAPFRPGLCGFLMLHKQKVDPLIYWKQEQERLENELAEEAALAPVTPSAVVYFSNKRAVSFLAQANTSGSATHWVVKRVPEPRALHWAAFSIPGYQAEVRSITNCVIMVLFTLFWTIPAAAIVALFNLENLASVSAFSWINLDSWSPAAVGVIEGALPPIIMAILISVVPTLVRTLVSKERLVSKSVIERKTRDYFYLFTIYGSFIVIVLGSSLLRDLNVIRNDPVQIIDALAAKVPGEGVFFASFIITQGCVSVPLAQSGLVRIVMRFIFLKLAKTERQKRKARTTSSIFQYFRYSGQAMLIMFLALMYSTFSPLVTFCGVLFFMLAFLSFRYQILFTTHAAWDGGGELYPGAYWGTMLGLMLKQLLCIIIMGLKQAAAQSILCFVPLICTALMTYVISKRYSRISRNGCMFDLCEKGDKMDGLPMNYEGVYNHPGVIQEEYENLNGIAEIKDVYSETEFDKEQLEHVQSEYEDEIFGYVPDRTALRDMA